jgi:bifunctional DNA-binding transcriptional regulator/antitoxin component of YhaV-PrlF toxin-antitoxin module
MGYESSVQVIERANHTRQYYLICPAPLAQALEMEKGEIIEWVVEDKHTLIIKRAQRRAETSALKGKRRG